MTKKKIRQAELLQIGSTLHLAIVAANRPDNILVLGALDLRPCQALDEGGRFFDALLGLGEAGVVDGREFRTCDAGKTARRIAAKICRLTDLTGQAEHIQIQPVGQQRRFLDLVGYAMSGSLVDDGARALSCCAQIGTDASYRENAMGFPFLVVGIGQKFLGHYSSVSYGG